MPNRPPLFIRNDRQWTLLRVPDAYFLAHGAPISATGIIACYFDAPTATGFLPRAAGAFDLVIEDAGYYNSGTQTDISGAEAFRFAANPTPGKATTYIITGTTRATLRVLTIEDP